MAALQILLPQWYIFFVRRAIAFGLLALFLLYVLVRDTAVHQDRRLRVFGLKALAQDRPYLFLDREERLLLQL